MIQSSFTHHHATRHQCRPSRAIGDVTVGPGDVIACLGQRPRTCLGRGVGGFRSSLSVSSSPVSAGSSEESAEATPLSSAVS